jgi:hypothetical protein
VVEAAVHEGGEHLCGRGCQLCFSFIGSISFRYAGNESSVGEEEAWGVVGRIGLTDSHEFFHLFSFHALLELTLLRSAEAETGKAVSAGLNLSLSL